MTLRLVLLVFLVSEAVRGAALILPIEGDELVPTGTVGVVLSPVAQCDAVPSSVRSFACQYQLLGLTSPGVCWLKVDFALEVVNRTEVAYAVGKEDFSCGYFSLELDFKMADGKVLTAKRKTPIWGPNYVEEHLIAPGRKLLIPVSLDPRLWTGLPERFCGRVIGIRPRYAYGTFKKDGVGYRTEMEMKLKQRHKRSGNDRTGELVGN